jgi:hypothetical protein
MALSASELLQLQQALTQLAKASSSIASFATQLGNVQSDNITAAQAETKKRRTVIDDYDSLSKVLQDQAKDFKNVQKTVDGFSQNLDDANRRHKMVSNALDTLQSSISAAGNATAAQTLKQTLLSRTLANVAAERETERSRIVEQSRNVSATISSLVQSSNANAAQRNEQEKQFYGRKLPETMQSALRGVSQVAGSQLGRQLPTSIQSALSGLAKIAGPQLSRQLMSYTNTGALTRFNDVQQRATQSLIANNQSIGDSSARLAQQYGDLGRSLDTTTSNFDQLTSQLPGAAGGTVNLSSESVGSIVNAQQPVDASDQNYSRAMSSGITAIARHFNNNNSNVRSMVNTGLPPGVPPSPVRPRTLPPGIPPGNYPGPQPSTPPGGAPPDSVKNLEKATEMLKAGAGAVGTYFTAEYDALTNFVQTNRLVALQLNMTEEQYRQSRAETKEVWNIAADSGQKQLDEFLTSRRNQLEDAYGSEPMLRDKMGAGFYKLNQVLGVADTEIDGMVKGFEKLSLTSRMSTTGLTELFFNLTNSNESLVYMNGLDEKGRQVRVQEIRKTVDMVSKLGLAGEAAEQFAKALIETAPKAPDVSELMSTYGSTQVLNQFITNLSQQLGIKPALSQEQVTEYGGLRMLQLEGRSLNFEQTKKLTEYSNAIVNFKADANKKLNEITQQQSDPRAAAFSILQQTQMLHKIDEFTATAKLDPLLEPLNQQKLVQQKYNETGDKLITSNDELVKALTRKDEQADQRAEDIGIRKQVTGVIAEVYRAYLAAQGTLAMTLAKSTGLTDLAEKAALRRLGGGAGGTALNSFNATGGGGGGAGGSGGVPSAARLAAGAGIAYEMRDNGNGTPTSQTDQPSESERANTPLPSSQLSAASTAESTLSLTEQFTKYFNSVDIQNTMMSGFLKQLADNSSGVGKDVKEWYQLYQDTHSITPLDGKTKKENTDPLTQGNVKP